MGLNFGYKLLDASIDKMDMLLCGLEFFEEVRLLPGEVRNSMMEADQHLYYL